MSSWPLVTGVTSAVLTAAFFGMPIAVFSLLRIERAGKPGPFHR